MKKKVLGIFTILVMGGIISPTYAAEPTAQGYFLVSGNWAQLKRGGNVLVLKITDSESKALTQANVKVAYDMVEMSMNPPDNPVEEKENGVYEKKIFLGMKGHWKFKTTIAVGPLPDPLKDTHEKVQEIKN